MKRLYIIGNGFDVAHGLHTDYWKFRAYLEQNYPEFLIEFEKLLPIIFTQYEETYILIIYIKLKE